MKMLDKRQIGAYPIPMGHGEISVEPVAGEGRTRTHLALSGTAARDLHLQRAQLSSCHRLRIDHLRSSVGLDQRSVDSSAMAVPPTWV
jgi:hypothetical protein